MTKSTVLKDAHPPIYRRAQDLGRSLLRITRQARVAVIAALVLSLGLWGVTIWLVVSSLARVWT
jgi:hypothetical protein